MFETRGIPPGPPPRPLTGDASTAREVGNGGCAFKAVQPWDAPPRECILPEEGAWQIIAMNHAPLPMNRKLVDALYVEAMLLADEARSYFDQNGRDERDALPPMQRVGFSCESLKVTTKLMHVIAWLLTRRAVDAGEISEAQAASAERRLGRGQVGDPEMVAQLPDTARQIIAATTDLYARVERLDRGMARPVPSFSPAQGLIQRLQAAF
jgi:regulator of CtrA degradation